MIIPSEKKEDYEFKPGDVVQDVEEFDYSGKRCRNKFLILSREEDQWDSLGTNRKFIHYQVFSFSTGKKDTLAVEGLGALERFHND